MKNSIKIMILCTPLLLGACASKQAAVSGGQTAVTTKSETDEASQKLQFVRKVAANKVTTQNIVGDMSFGVKSGSKSVLPGGLESVPGSVHMRWNEVIRLQIFVPLLGSEVARLEFTPNYVLVIDRMNKQYVKGDYNQLSFLRENGLNFYTLQALFWNQLAVPGTRALTDSEMKKLDVLLTTTASHLPVTYNQGNFRFMWTADRNSGRIAQTMVTYGSAQHGTSTLTWEYANFQNVAGKLFPAKQSFTFKTALGGKRQDATVTISMNGVKTSSDWEPLTTPSSKYKQVNAEDVLGRLMNMM